MTNYNERLDEVLGKLIIGTQDLDFNKAHPNTHQHYVNRAEAKQAITSLIKDLVEEAKPKDKPVETMRILVGVKNIILFSSENLGFNDGTSDYHQNIKKILGE